MLRRNLFEGFFVPTRQLHVRTMRPDREDLKKFVASLPRTNRELGLTHITNGYVLRESLDRGDLRPVNKCEVFNEAVLYAFYGRPAFRRTGDERPTDLA